MNLFLWIINQVKEKLENDKKYSLVKRVKTLGELKKSGYKPRSIKEEIRENLIKKLKNKEEVFPGIKGFDDTVLPDLQRAILSRHNILLLGLRGQAKTRIARLMVNLLDEYIPVIDGSPLNEDPLDPITHEAQEILEKDGDKTSISWVHRDERYVEKLATPDVSVADLIGDVDPIKAATLKLSYADERVLHFGLVPRAHRSIFVINELPDLQPRIQVSLFNILQEGDLQIRGFKLRLPLDIQFLFTANPEDYTNRGSIITPLKDRIESQILTHYPTSIEIAKQITENEAKVHKDQAKVKALDIHKELIERMVFAARESDFVDEKSGVSARLSITAYENLISTAELRMVKNGEKSTNTRLIDFWGIVPAITGKLELVYEGEQEGPYQVAMSLIDEAVKQLFLEYFPDPRRSREGESDLYGALKAFFSDNQKVELLADSTDVDYINVLNNVPGLKKLVSGIIKNEEDRIAMMEIVLNALASFEVIEKSIMGNQITFDDPLGDILGDLN